jgi:hypothetical protein
MDDCLYFVPVLIGLVLREPLHFSPVGFNFTQQGRSRQFF